MNDDFSFDSINHLITSLSPNVFVDYPFGKDITVYKVNVENEPKMFALINHAKHPLALSLKCDPGLAVLLRERYESVMPGYHLHKKHWNTIVLSGQLEIAEVRDLIVHSFNLVTGLTDSAPAKS